MYKLVLLLCVGAFFASPAVGQSILYEWSVTDTSDAGTTLTAEGSASGRSLTATIAPPIKINGSDVTLLFDAEIDRRLAGTTIIDRKDRLRVVGLGLYSLITLIDYKKAGESSDKRMILFTATGSTSDDEMRIVMADGPFDRQLMDDYSGDVATFAINPEAAIAGTLAVQPNPGAVKKATPKTKPTEEPAQSVRKDLPPSNIPATPKGWSRKDYNGTSNYWPTTGPLTTDAKTGYLAVSIYDPVSLNKLPLDQLLNKFTLSQEERYDVRRRETAIMDGPHRAWSHLRIRNKHGVSLDVSYIAIRTGENTVRIVREILTDDDYKERSGYAPGLDRLYRHIENETAPDFLTDTSSATTMQLMTKLIQTESSIDRIKRRSRAKTAARERHQNAVSSKRGQGIQPGDIAHVFLRSDFLKRAYGGKNASFSVYVLLKDGSAYHNPTRPPSDIDREASRRLEADQWVQWRKSGKDYQIRTDANAPWKKLKGKFAKAAPSKTMSFQGKHIAAWGNVLSGTAGHRTGSILLTRKGRYETSSFALAGGAGITGLPAATVSNSTGKNGTQTTTSSNVAPALINNTKRDPNGTDFTGQYALQGYTAEFLSDSGKLRRTLFLMTADGGVYASGRYYSANDK